jgi:hypothetical protein
MSTAITMDMGCPALFAILDVYDGKVARNRLARVLGVEAADLLRRPPSPASVKKRGRSQIRA